MKASLFLVGAALLGVGLVRRALGRVLDGAEQTLWGLVGGWMLATLAAYGAARVLGRLSGGAMFALTIALCVAALALWLPAIRRKISRGVRARDLWSNEHAGLLLVLALFAPIYAGLFSSHMLSEGAGGVYSGGSCWGDLGLHLAVSSSFLYSENFPPAYTLFPPEPLAYPFLPDFLTAALASLGMSLRAALLSTGVALSLAITGLFYTLARRITRLQTEEQNAHERAQAQADDANASTRETRDGELLKDSNGIAVEPPAQVAAVMATILFLLNGGLGFVYFYSDWRASGKGLADFWSHLTRSYTNMGDRHIQWTNLITDTLLPQRTSLFGIPAALMIFTMFAVAWQATARGREEGRWAGWRALCAAGVVAGALPLFHTHTYLAVGLLSGFLFLLRPRRAWLAFWLPALLLALPHLVSLTGHVASAGGFMRLQPGWRVPAEQSFLVYWLRNVGLPLLLIIPAWLSASRTWRTFYLAFVALKLVSLFVVFTPNDYDNIKLLFYWHAATCVLVGAWLVRLASVRRQRLLASVLALGCVASGLLSLRHESLSRGLFLNRDELEASRFVREHTAPRALFLAAPALHQPVVSLAGRPVVRGFTAWLWSHGHTFAEREADVRAIYAGRDDAVDLLRYYRVDYVYLGQHEKRDLKADQSFFERTLAPVFRNASVTIYDARPLSSSEGEGEGARRLREPYPPREFASRLDKDPHQILVEFPHAAFALYRYYKVAYGRIPRFQEFMEDMRVLGRGVYVGAPGWREKLEGNKTALTDAWAERAEFRERHSTSNDDEYVAALYANASVAPDVGERERLVGALGAGRESRASALRLVAESRKLYAREYNTAYVLAHYFGYLRRNPDDPPDKDWTGFRFWLDNLNRKPDYRNVTLVFIESGEYKDQGKGGK